MKLMKFKVKWQGVALDCWINPHTIAWVVEDEKKKTTYLVFTGTGNGWEQRLEIEDRADKVVKLIEETV